MDINIENYLDRFEIKEIIISELRNKIANIGQKYLAELITESIRDGLIRDLIPLYKEELSNRVKESIEEESYFIFKVMECGGGAIIEKYLQDNPELLITKIQQIEDDSYNDKIIEALSYSLSDRILETIKKSV